MFWLILHFIQKVKSAFPSTLHGHVLCKNLDIKKFFWISENWGQNLNKAFLLLWRTILGNVSSLYTVPAIHCIFSTRLMLINKNAYFWLLLYWLLMCTYRQTEAWLGLSVPTCWHVNRKLDFSDSKYYKPIYKGS